MDGIEIELDSLRITGDPTTLYSELAKAALEFAPVPKTNVGQVGQQKFKYAGYAKLMRCVRPALSAHGITILQPLHWRGELAVTTTILAGHGASIQSSFAFEGDFKRKQKDGSSVSDPQEFGRHHTYYRRYQLQAMLGLEGDADADDLPDVNEEREPAQYTEPAPAKASGKSKPKAAEVTAPPMLTAAPTEPSTVAKTETKPAPAVDGDALKTINEMLAMGMKELKWTMGDVREFYKQHVNPEGFVSASNLTIENKQALFTKMVELKDVTPF